MELGLVSEDEFAVLDATAHALKFSGFQDMYFSNSFPAEFGVTPDTSLANAPELVVDSSVKEELAPEAFTEKAAKTIADKLGLQSK